MVQRVRRVLVDRVADGQLRRDGFTRIRLVSTEAAQALRTEYGRLRTEGSGFEADLTNPDVDYRRAVDRLLRSHLETAVRDRFVGYEPFLWNFLCRWPHDDEDLYLHRDWMFVDERRGAHSYTVWLALQDVVGDNGRLRVLPRSHRLRGTLVGSGLSPAWLSHGAVISPRLRSLDVQAGEAVVMDHALVHCSFANRTDVARVSVGCALRPVTEPLVHFRRNDGPSAAKYLVDEQFFLTHTPQDLEERPPALQPVEVLSTTTPRLERLERIGAEELARRLDGGVLGSVRRTRAGHLLDAAVRGSRRREAEVRSG